jgi:hypothetical protein
VDERFVAVHERGFDHATYHTSSCPISHHYDPG